MKDRVKKALKRAASGLMAVLLAVCLVGTPRAKAVVSEGALLGSLFGSLLVSMGFTWAAENMDVPTFGESIYKLIQEHDEVNKDTGVQLIRDLTIAGLTSSGAGKIAFPYQWTQAARSFVDWLYDKYALAENDSAIISSDLSVTDDSGITHIVCTADLPDSFRGMFYPTSVGSSILKYGDPETTYYFGGKKLYLMPSGTDLYASGDSFSGFYRSGWGTDFDTVSLLYSGGYLYFCSNSLSGTGEWHTHIIPSRRIAAVTLEGSALSVSVPNGLDVSDIETITPEQAYELTFEGVTATDIEGIIQGAVDRILAGTAAIAGSIVDAQAGTGEEVANPEIDPYKVGLSSVFPFCIPFDVYNMVTMFVAEPEAPHAEWTFNLPWSNQEYSVGWDLSDFDGVAQVCRSMELVLFAVGLAVITYKVIKW